MVENYKLLDDEKIKTNHNFIVKQFTYVILDDVQIPIASGNVQYILTYCISNYPSFKKSYFTAANNPESVEVLDRYKSIFKKAHGNENAGVYWITNLRKLIQLLEHNTSRDAQPFTPADS